MSGFRRVDAALGRVYRVVGNLVGVVIALFAVAISADLVLRLAGLGNLPGLQEIIEYLLYVTVFLAAPWVLRLNAHVRVDMVLRALPAPLAVALERIVDVAALATCGVLAWFGWVNLANAWKFNAMQHQYYVVPEWFLLSFFVACFALVALEFLFRLIRAGAAPEAAEAQEEGGF